MLASLIKESIRHPDVREISIRTSAPSPNPDKPEPKREKLLPNITPILKVRY
jgi:hypothetical protein